MPGSLEEGRMRVLLVYPQRDPRSSVRSQYEWKTLFELLYWPFPSRGGGLKVNVLDTLASLAPPGVEVRTVNEHTETIDFDAPADLVAITCMVTHATRGYEIADAFRKRGIPVIMGGYHPFMMHQFGNEAEVFEHVDSICLTEGDDVWAEILNDARRGELKRVYRQDHLTDMQTVEHRLVSRPRQWLDYLYLTIQASRGCPFHCNFCSIIQMLGNKMRYKTPEAVTRELEAIYQRDLLGRTLGRPIFFVDDNIFGVPKEFKRILRAIIALNKRYPRFRPYYGCQATINVTKDPEAMELLREAGFFQVFIGLESLEPAVLGQYDKKQNVGYDYDAAIQTLRGYGIEVVASFIFGQDLETREAFDAAFDFFDRNDIIYPYCNILVPNQKQWIEYDEAGRILTREWKLYDAQHTVFVPANFRPRELQQGYIDLMTRVFDYANVKKRLVKAFVEGGARQVRLPYPLQVLTYAKTLAALAVKRDRDGLRFAWSLRGHVLTNRLSALNIMFQIDQHDFAVKNVGSMAEHPYDLDVPSWSERAAARPARPEPVSADVAG
jgi:radical SAM superfamily enzyme YgiQ (UPF0313 family)